MAKVFLFCGLPSSGKSTYAREIAANNGARHYSLDKRMQALGHFDIFQSEYGDIASHEKEKIWNEALVDLSQGKDVIPDWSLWSKRARKEWINIVTTSGYEYQLTYLEIPLELAAERLEKRNKGDLVGVQKIPVSELKRFSSLFEPPSDDEGIRWTTVKA